MNLSNPAELKAFLQRHGFEPQKQLGQHFLCSQTVVEKIMARLSGINGVLEIGPGPGVLTQPASELCQTLIALEIDPRAVAALAESAPKAEVRVSDALRVDLAKILDELPAPKAILSNMPYNITGLLLQAFAGARGSISKAVLMMQREVATRILAPAGNSDRGSLSVYLQAQFTISKVASVPAGAFFPPPKVESVVLEFLPLPTNENPQLFEFIRAGFTHPRKTLANNLLVFGSRQQVEQALSRSSLDARIRPHQLTLDQWRGAFLSLHE